MPTYRDSSFWISIRDDKCFLRILSTSEQLLYTKIMKMNKFDEFLMTVLILILAENVRITSNRTYDNNNPSVDCNILNQFLMINSICDD